jgi:cytochrome c553
MWDTATSLGAKKARALADFFASQAPTPPHGGSALAAKGKTFYETGCQSCHGAQAEGKDASPRLAGQHNVYLSRQLANFSMTTRFHASMNPPSRSLTDNQIEAVVAYLGGD